MHKHFSEAERKLISHFISQDLTLKEMAMELDCDPTAISKEVKRNRTITKRSELFPKQLCKQLRRFPYICRGCKEKGFKCPYQQYDYYVAEAQRKSDYRLVFSRTGLDATEEELNELNDLLKVGKMKHYSVTSVLLENQINKSPSTVYRYINNGNLKSFKRMDLPYAVKYKKRKHNLKYDYGKSQIDRTNRTYLDYVNFKIKEPSSLVWQFDFLGRPLKSSHDILTIIEVNLHFLILIKVENKTSESIGKIIDFLENLLGIENFKKIFPIFLTDREPVFQDYRRIEFNQETGEKRTSLFYCDPYNGSQKGCDENMNGQLRLYFPKGKSFDKETQEHLNYVQDNINERRVLSLAGFSPKEAFIKIFGETNYQTISSKKK